MSPSAPLHASLLACFTAAGWRGVLLRGPSGAGKSGLALAMMARRWRLVADDRVVAWSSGGRAWGRAPAVLKGLLEVRGVGVISRPVLDFSEICWVVDCLAPPDGIERIPEPALEIVCGVSLPVCRIDACARSAADKVIAFCDALRL